MFIHYTNPNTGATEVINLDLVTNIQSRQDTIHIEFTMGLTGKRKWYYTDSAERDDAFRILTQHILKSKELKDPPKSFGGQH